MSTDPPRRRIRRAQQTRQVSHPVPERDPHPISIPTSPDAIAASPFGPAPGTDPETVMPRASAAPMTEDVPTDLDLPDDRVATPAFAPDPTRDGAWLPAGITLLVMAGLLLCAGLVLIAAQR